jgi:hypothetical protein
MPYNIKKNQYHICKLISKYQKTNITKFYNMNW